MLTIAGGILLAVVILAIIEGLSDSGPPPLSNKEWEDICNKTGYGKHDE